MTYRELRNQQEQEFNKFPCFFAYNEKQFTEGMHSLGVTGREELYRGYGGMFYRKSDAGKLHDLINKFDAEMKDAFKDDTFLFNAFCYEMANHEYCLTFDKDEVLGALGLTSEEIECDRRMDNIWRKASKEYFAEQDA